MNEELLLQKKSQSDRHWANDILNGTILTSCHSELVEAETVKSML